MSVKLDGQPLTNCSPDKGRRCVFLVDADRTSQNGLMRFFAA